jgi:hypothetical protein
VGRVRATADRPRHPDPPIADTRDARSACRGFGAWASAVSYCAPLDATSRPVLTVMVNMKPDKGSGPPGRDEQFHDFVADRRGYLLHTARLLTAGDTFLAEDLVQTALTKLYVS